MCLETFVGAMVSFSAVAKRICAKKTTKNYFSISLPFTICFRNNDDQNMYSTCWKCKCRFFSWNIILDNLQHEKCIFGRLEDKLMLFIRLHHVKGLFFPYFDAIFIDVSLYYLFDKNIFNKNG